MSHNSHPIEYFDSTSNPLHKQYLAMRMFFVDGKTAEESAVAYGYTKSTAYTYVNRFKERLAAGDGDPFFKEPQAGRKKIDHGGGINDLVVAYRKKNFSVPEIKAALDAQNIGVSERYISLLLAGEGFARLPRRDNAERRQVSAQPASCRAPISEPLSSGPDKFSTHLAGLLLFLPIIKNYGIDRLIAMKIRVKGKA